MTIPNPCNTFLASKILWLKRHIDFFQSEITTNEKGLEEDELELQALESYFSLKKKTLSSPRLSYLKQRISDFKRTTSAYKLTIAQSKYSLKKLTEELSLIQSPN